MHRRLPDLYKFLLFALLLCATQAQAQLVNTTFGKNRLQYERKNWYRYEADHFAINFPQELEGLAKFVIEQAEEDYQQLKTSLEYTMRNKVEIILYGNYVDYLQNNIGLYTQTTNNGGTTRLFAHKILLYMHSSRNTLRYQLREGIARSLVNRMTYGGNFQEVVQNSVQLQMPKWFTEGMIGYALNEWDSEADNNLREAFLSGEYPNYWALANKNPALAGRSMFHYISQTYGTAAVGNVFYLTRISRSVESGYLQVFGASFYAVANNWFEYYQTRYNNDNQERRIPSKGALTLPDKKEAKYAQVALSRNGKYAAYISLHKGQYSVWLHDIEADAATLVWKGGTRSLSDETPLNYPCLAFSPTGRLFFSTHEKHKLLLHQYDVETKKMLREVPVTDMDFINSLSHGGDANTVLVSGLDGGVSDIFRIDAQSGKAKNLTNDLYDDIQPAAVNLGGRSGFAFMSMRPAPRLGNPANKDSLQHNLFPQLYFSDGKSRELLQLSDQPVSLDIDVVGVDDSTIAYLSDANGMFNRYICRLDTTILRYNRHARLKSGEEIIIHADSALTLPEGAVIDTQFLVPVLLVKGKSYPNSDYSRSILEHDVAQGAQKVADLIYYDGEYQLFIRDLRTERTTAPQPTEYRRLYLRLWGIGSASENQPKKGATSTPISKPSSGDTLKTSSRPREIQIPEEGDSLPPAPKKDSGKIDIDNYLFQSEFGSVKNPVPDTSKPQPVVVDSARREPAILVEDPDGTIKKNPAPPRPTPEPRPALAYKFDPARKFPYRNLFRADGFALQFDNTPLFGGLDLYLGGHYRFTPFTFGFRTNFSDIFENYRIEIAARVPITFNGFDCYFQLEDRKGKLDKKYIFYRRTRTEDYNLIDTTTNIIQAARGRNIKHLAQFELKYPLSPNASLRGMVGVQHDQIAILAQEINSLSVAPYVENRVWLRAEYVFDNTVELRMNLRKGTRFKAYADFFQPLAVRTDSVFRVDLSGGITANIGFDYRFYHPVGKSIIALRAAGASSFGGQKILYSLGGVENWLTPSTDRLIPLPENDVFAYQTLAAPLRGFSNNARNGNSFMVVNAEWRLPVAEMLGLTSARSNLVRTLQLVPFFDIGTAWQGLSPFSADNPLNTTIIDRSSAGSVSPIRVRVNYYRQPILFGFGMGFRTMVSGYFLRADLGFGVETGQLQTPKLQVAIGTDF